MNELDCSLGRLEEAGKLARKRERARRRFLRSEDGKLLVEWMRERFEVGVVCYQYQDVERQCGYDPLDAMRRDAWREVFLWLTSEPVGGDEDDDGEEGDGL